MTTGVGYARTVPNTNWVVAGMGDFDGDAKADVWWRNTSTGENYIFPMDGLAIKATEGYVRTVPDQNWQVAGLGDFDGDGKSDVLWHNAVTGQSYVYFMDGLTIKPTEGYIRTVADTNWKIAAVADLDGDGKADIFWRNSATGQQYVYLMDGLNIVNEAWLRTAGTDWKIVGSGDVDGDGKADIVWRNFVTGENYIYTMSGLSITAGEGYIRWVGNQDWQVASVADFDGDGNADILWRNNVTGELYLYPMAGTTIKANEGYLIQAPWDWVVVSK
jgi:hypothetical protein